MLRDEVGEGGIARLQKLSKEKDALSWNFIPLAKQSFSAIRKTMWQFYLNTRGI